MHIPVSGRYAPVFGQIGLYPFMEAMGVVKRNVLGPSLHNQLNIEFAPSGHILNDIEPQLTVGFGGDVMMMFGRAWNIDPSLQDFFAPCDALVLNMEGVITDKPKRGVDQKHDHRIIDSLLQLFPANKTWLSLANNHAADFGMDECRNSKLLFEKSGFHCFGLHDSPFADLHPALRVVTGTQWSNHRCAELAWLDEKPEQHRRAGAFNMLFPHWSYEMECFPRAWAANQMQAWLKQFDSVIGHHSHTPQPLTCAAVMDERQQVAAYSLGDLCFGWAFKGIPTLKHYPYGVVIRAQIGPLKSDPKRMAIGRLDWSFVDCQSSPDRTSFTSTLVSKVPYF